MSRLANRQFAAKRRQARHYAVQALYQWLLADSRPADIEAEFREDYDFNKVDGEYFHILVHQVPARLAAIETIYTPFMVARAVQELGPVERALLAIGTFELQERTEIPYKVVISEAVLLAKKFGAQDSHKFINGVLDPVARSVRQMEFKLPGAAGARSCP